MKRLEQKENFIRALAEFLAGNPAAKSIALEMESKSPSRIPGISWAKDWANLGMHVPGMVGYCSVDEAEVTLRKFLM